MGFELTRALSVFGIRIEIGIAKDPTAKKSTLALRVRRQQQKKNGEGRTQLGFLKLLTRSIIKDFSYSALVIFRRLFAGGAPPAALELELRGALDFSGPAPLLSDIFNCEVVYRSNDILFQKSVGDSKTRQQSARQTTQLSFTESLTTTLPNVDGRS